MFNDYIIDERIRGFRYAREQPERIQFVHLKMALFHNDHEVHKLEKKEERWYCDCYHFYMMQQQEYPVPFCSHVIAVEKVLERDLKNDVSLRQSFVNKSRQTHHYLTQNASSFVLAAV